MGAGPSPPDRRSILHGEEILNRIANSGQRSPEADNELLVHWTVHSVRQTGKVFVNDSLSCEQVINHSQSVGLVVLEHKAWRPGGVVIHG
jgi:hypothetical protein